MDYPKRNALAVPPLPDEAILEILARAPFRTVCRSKCVSRPWRDLIADPLNRRRLPQTLQGFFSMFPPMWNRDDPSSDDMEHFFIRYSAASPAPLDVDPCLSFLTKLPGTESVDFVDSCNGLLLFEHYTKSNPDEMLGYIVCNPATKHWAAVPVCARCPPPKAQSLTATYLVFDPARAVSPHFHLIQLWKEGGDEEARLTFGEIEMLPLSVHTYSSETGVWSHSQTGWNEQGRLEGWRRQGGPKYGLDQRTFVNGILHLMVYDQDRHQIIAIDVQGKTERIITMPDAVEGRQCCKIPCIGQSQGRVHYINRDSNAHDSGQLHIWELQDYDTQEWVLKGTVSFLSLFGRTRTLSWDFVFNHPDRNVVFFFQQQPLPLMSNRLIAPLMSNKLIAYDMDRKEVNVVFMSSENLEGEIVPYVPYFSELPALTNKD